MFVLGLAFNRSHKPLVHIMGILWCVQRDEALKVQNIVG